jgi:hypothetical protein
MNLTGGAILNSGLIATLMPNPTAKRINKQRY